MPPHQVADDGGEVGGALIGLASGRACAEVLKHEVNVPIEPIGRNDRGDALRNCCGDVMKDMQEHLERLRVQISECEIIHNSATDPKTREMFGELAEQHKVLAGWLEKAVQNAESCRGDSI